MSTSLISVLAPLAPSYIPRKEAGCWRLYQPADSRLSHPTAGSVPHLTLNYLNSSWLLMILGREQGSLDLPSTPSFTCRNLLSPHPQLHTAHDPDGGGGGGGSKDSVLETDQLTLLLLYLRPVLFQRGCCPKRSTRRRISTCCCCCLTPSCEQSRGS